MAWYDALAVGSDILGGIGQTAYNIYTNKRDFDYQKALQKQIFEREDTAVQRRMADLENAGLNPNLAAGSAANAGSVVARSSTNDINVGSSLDALAAINQIKLQRQEQENKQIEHDILLNNRSKTASEALYNKAEVYSYFGIPFGFLQSSSSKEESDIDMVLYGNNDGHLFQNSPIEQLIQYQMQNQKNTADMIQKENNWYTTNQVLNSVGSVIGDIADIGGLFKPKFYKGKFVK